MKRSDGGTQSANPAREEDESHLALVQLLRDQPEKGLPVLLRQYGGILRNLSFSYSRNPEDREDLFQEIVFELLEGGCRRLRNWEPGRASFPCYLYLVVRYICLNYRRKADRIMRFTLSSEKAGDEPVRELGQVPGQAESATQRTTVAISEAVDRLNECFAALIEAGAAREGDRLLVTLRAEGHSARAVGGILGLNEDVVNLRYSRVRKRLMDCMGRHGIKSMQDLLIDFAPVGTI